MIALLAVLALQQAAAPADSPVGIVPVVMVTSAPAETLRAIVWYPSASASRDTVLGLRPVSVALRGAFASGLTRYPVVLISHGTGGNEFGHLDAALALARAGYVVASLRHPGDNFLDDSGLGTDRQFYGRSHQVARLLDHLLADSALAPHLDPSRIGFLGFSAGGYTGMTLLGARPDFSLFAAYCAQHPDAELYCASGLQGSVRLGTRYSAPRADPRIRAAMLYAPAFGFLLDSSSVAAIRTTVRVMRAASDEVVREPENVTRLATLFAGPLAVGVVAGGHYVFLAPCGAALTARAPAICEDPAGVDRELTHRQLNEDLVAFFDRTLGRR